MIAGTRCGRCGRVSADERDRCLACGAGTEPARFEPSGRVLGRTRRAQVDAWVALIELSEGARILARAADEVEVGDRVVVTRVQDGYQIEATRQGQRA